MLVAISSLGNRCYAISAQHCIVAWQPFCALSQNYSITI
jgi:hypothetical protein